MRAWDIILFFCVAMQVAIVFVGPSGLNVFGNNTTTYYTPDPNYRYSYNLTDLQQFNVTNQSYDYASTGAKTAGAGMFVINALVGIFYIFPTLVDVFHCPPPLAVVFQAIIYIIYAVGILGWLSGRHPDNYP